MRTPTSTGLAAAAVAVFVLTFAGRGAQPASAADPCTTSTEAAFVCRAYESFARRAATTQEIETWTPQLPARRTNLVATVARSVESRRATVVAYYARFGLGTPSATDTDYWDDEIATATGLRRLEAALVANRQITAAELVTFAYDVYLGRAPTPADVSYWQSRIASSGRNRVAADIAYTAEARKLRVAAAYTNELLVAADTLGRDYWAQRIRAGTTYLELRIALRSTPAGYTRSGGACSPPAPQTGPTCP